MNIVFAHNVFNRFKTLKETIDIERKFFPNSHEFIACNSQINDDFFNQLENADVKYYLETPDHKLGCVNGLILSCNMGIKEEFDVLVFSHDDIRINSKYIDIVMKHIDDIYLNNYDIIYKNPEWIGINYAMLEVVFMNKKASESLFLNTKLLGTELEIGFYYDSISPEHWFYNKIKNTDLKTNVIKQYNVDMKLSEQMGYDHLNSGSRGWTD